VGSIKKGEKLLIPKGSTRIEEGDLLAVFVLSGDVAQVEKLFQVSIDFF
jgi:trk system potassium uptake protein TrkA